MNLHPLGQAESSRTSERRREIPRLESRDLHLLVIGLIVIVVLAMGFATLIFPNVAWRLDFLPEHTTDFIFAVFSEEWGFVGCLILLLLYFLLVAYSLRLIRRAKDRFGALLVFGLVSIFFWHVVINVAMVTGMMPVVGVPLPLLSYGGSSLASMMFAVGLVINASMRRFIF